MTQPGKDLLLRYVYLKTLSSKDCENHVAEHGWGNASLCAEPNSYGGHVYLGDSGKVDARYIVENDDFIQK